jgi:hypothetical protein
MNFNPSIQGGRTEWLIHAENICPYVLRARLHALPTRGEWNVRT